MKRILILVVMGLFLYAGNSLIYAEDVMSDKEFGWVNIGTGQSGMTLFSLRSTYSTEFILFGPNPSENVWDSGALMGISLKSKYLMTSLSGGLGVVGGVRRGEIIGESGGWLFSQVIYEEIHFITAGIPIEAQLFFTPTATIFFLGIGVYGFANINFERPIVGMMLCVQLGKLM